MHGRARTYIVNAGHHQLLCTSSDCRVHCALPTCVPSHAGKGVDFIVDVGPRVATQSTVVDMTSDVPQVVRHGKGEASYFEA